MQMYRPLALQKRLIFWTPYKYYHSYNVLKTLILYVSASILPFREIWVPDNGEYEVSCVLEWNTWVLQNFPGFRAIHLYQLIFSYEDILLLWKKESSKLNFSRWAETKKKSTVTAPYS